MNDYRIRYFDDIREGMTGEFSKTVKETDIQLFADVTGDTNPLHLDAEYAAGSIFGERIAHGMLAAGMISAVFGRVFPGPGWIYVRQTLGFKAPVRIGDTVVSRVEALECIEKREMVTFKTECRVADKVVLEGEATLLAPKKT
jgi:3-hydroxybutyryl-CoA dehydratase